MRPSAHKRGYNKRWQRASKRHLAKYPWCVHCEKRDVKTPATEVDHRIPHKGDMRLFWKESLWTSLCKPCHSSKTRSEQTGKPISGCDSQGYPVDPEYHETMKRYA